MLGLFKREWFAPVFRREKALIEQMHKVATVAPQVGMTKGALYSAIRAGQFPAIRIGTRVRVPESGLRRWIETQMQVPAERQAAARAEAAA